MNAPANFHFHSAPLRENIRDEVAARLAAAKAICGEESAPELIAAVLLDLGAEARWRTSRGEAADF